MQVFRGTVIADFRSKGIVCMKKRLWNSAAVAGAILLLAAAGCRPNQTIERQTDDAGIKTSIKAKLASDVRFSTLTAVSVPYSRRPDVEES